MRAFLLSFHALLLMAACGSLDGSGTNQGTDASTDSATCSGLPPDNCDGCCGQTYAADLCVNGAWTCRIAGGACSPCDGGHDATASDAMASDATTCTGTAPVICNGCCGNKYAADQCTNGVWSCLPRGIACVICDAATYDAPPGDALGGGCGLAGEACCPAGSLGALRVAPCNLGLTCCQPAGTCSAQCADGGSDAGDASLSSGRCGARDDAGTAYSGTCPAGQYCCDQSHTGATGFVCHDADAACLPVP